jgi:hypothetical protein
MVAIGVARASWTLTIVLTTTGADKPPLSPILPGVYGQVSHGMPQPARSLQAGGHGCRDGEAVGRVIMPTSPCPLRYG